MWVLHKYANFIDQTRPQLLCFNRFRGELGHRCDEADPPVEWPPRKAVGTDGSSHSRVDLSQIRLADIGPDPLWIDERQIQHRPLWRGHFPRLQEPGPHDRIAWRHKFRIRQLTKKKLELRLIGA